MAVNTAIYGILLTLAASNLTYDLASGQFQRDYASRESTIENQNWQALQAIEQQSPSARGRFFLTQIADIPTTNAASSQFTLPETFYLYVHECGDVKHCSVFKKRITNQLSKHFSVIDQDNIGARNNRNILCDVDILKDCNDSLGDTESQLLLPQLVLEVKQWESSGIEVNIALLNGPQVLATGDIYQPLTFSRKTMTDAANAVVSLVTRK